MTLPLLAGSPASAATQETWDKVAECESGGRWSIATGNGYYGGLQFSPTTWREFGGTGDPSKASKAEQIRIAEKVLAVQGPGAWPHCGPKAGLKKSDAEPNKQASSADRSLTAQGEQSQSVQGKSSKSNSSKSNHRSTEGKQQAGNQHRTYTIQSGDTLANIATDQTTGTWQQLYEANRPVIGPDANIIHPGQKLTLPAGQQAETTQPSSAPKAPSTPRSSQAAQSTQSTNSAAVSPVANTAVSAHYGIKGSMWAAGHHTGVDFPVPTGTQVRSVGPGTVISAGYDGSYGNQVLVKSDDGMYVLYAHLSQTSVSSGHRVAAGQQLGLSGNTGNSTGSHLHFEVRTTPQYGSAVDPVAYLNSKSVRL
ncbi:transglycosylase family protein [Streptomyces vinaceus]|uniref:transglycosylase family protein n=1 Tax=Streptomyces vinaceus TaxID=1960 RepID=UPI003826C869